MTYKTEFPKDVRKLEALVRARGFGGTLPERGRLAPPPAPSGIAALDAQLGGGLPRGAITEVVGPGSSGRTGLVLATVAQATRAGEAAAYVDAADCLDPRSAARAGAVLERLLWIRCGPGSAAPGGGPGDDAWQAANLVAAAGGFGVVALDIGGLRKHEAAAWQRKPWVRLQRAVEGTPAALVVLSARRLTGSAAGAVLELRREGAAWDGLLGGVAVRAEVRKGGARGPFGRAAWEVA